jgi:four helix bundle protein
MNDKVVKSFKDLNVYAIAFKLSVEIHNLSKGFPPEERFDLTRQIRRASKSVCANIAEGFIKQNDSKPEFGRFLSMALGSATEVRVWLDYCSEFGYIDKVNYNNLSDGYIKVAAMINKLKNSLVR